MMVGIDSPKSCLRVDGPSGQQQSKEHLVGVRSAWPLLLLPPRTVILAPAGCRCFFVPPRPVRPVLWVMSLHRNRTVGNEWQRYCPSRTIAGYEIEKLRSNGGPVQRARYWFSSTQSKRKTPILSPECGERQKHLTGRERRNEERKLSVRERGSTVGHAPPAYHSNHVERLQQVPPGFQVMD